MADAFLLLDTQQGFMKNILLTICVDTTFAKNVNAQFDFVFLNSPYLELVNLRYPVYRVRN